MGGTKDKGRFGHLELGGVRPGIVDESPADTRKFSEDEYVARAHELYRDGKFDDALRLYSRALGRNHHLEAAWVGQLRCLLAVEEYRELDTWAAKALEYLPDSPELLSVQAIALACEGHHTAAMQLSDRAVSKKGSTPFVWIARAWALGKPGERNADLCITRAVDSGKTDWQIHADAASYFIAYEQFGSAIVHLQQASRLHPDCSYIWYQLGMCYVEVGLRNEAIAALNHAVKKDPRRQKYFDALREAEEQNLFKSIWRRLFGKGE